ncbi:MAG: hypothetical protein AAGA30_09440 [Planctomycetota bacterium]
MAIVHSLNDQPQSRRGQGWCMPKTIRRFGGKLLSQQLWCWGKDITHDDGNLLLRYGFERHRDTGEDPRSTCYRLDINDMHVALWGFGMFFGRRELGGLFLGRFEFCPEWSSTESISVPIHWPDDLPALERPQGAKQWRHARKLWASMLEWIADYERWVEETAGIEFRDQCVASWLRPFVHSKKMAGAWQFLSDRRWDEDDENQTLHQQLQTFTISSNPNGPTERTAT